jgi:hypothetical protein
MGLLYFTFTFTFTFTWFYTFRQFIDTLRTSSTINSVHSHTDGYIPVCKKSKCTDFLFNYLLDLPEITSYLLQSMTLGKLHSGSSVTSTDHSSPGSHFL